MNFFMKIHHYLITLSILLIFGCAKEGMPPGGPEDRTAPEIVRTVPLLGETKVLQKTSVLVQFSESVNPTSAADAIFISPYPGAKIKNRWRGRNLKIIFPKPFESNRTYVITLGTSIRDYRNNPMKSSFTLAFSTGEILDEGEITGKIYTKADNKAIDVWAYRIKEDQDPNPSRDEPDYVIQCSIDGSFRLTYIAPFKYRLFAVRDRAADRIYQSGEDEIGVPFCDADLSSDKNNRVDSLFFRMSSSDTLSPVLVRAVSVNRNHVIAQFSEPVFITGTQPSPPFAIVSVSDTTDTLGIRFHYCDPVQSKLIHLHTEDMDQNTDYRIRTQEIADGSDNPVDAEYNTMQFGGMGQPDTTRPELTLTRPAFKETTADPFAPLRLCFDEAIDSMQFSSGCILKNSAGQTVNGIYRWKNPAECTFSPDGPLMSQANYNIVLSGTGVRDLAGNGLVDTVIFFRTINIDTLSEILGTVFDRDTAAQGEIFVTASQIKNPDIKYTAAFQQPGPYRIESVLPGEYLIDAYRDENGDRNYTTGSPFPFVPSERFTACGDTVKIRSRWPNEGNNLELP
jgi:hypothetical protein